jgi:hypothetical protein
MRSDERSVLDRALLFPSLPPVCALRDPSLTTDLTIESGIAAGMSQALRKSAPLPAKCRAVLFRVRNSGLANRIRALVAYRALSRIVGAEFYVDWAPSTPCDAELHALFDTRDLNLTTEKQFKEMVSSANGVVVSQSDWFEIIWQAYLAEHCTWPRYVQEVKACLRELRPNEALLERTNDFAGRHDFPTLTGMHIRNTDNVREYESWAQNSPGFKIDEVSRVEDFVAVLESPRGSTRYFLATDNWEVEKLITKRFASRVIVYPKTYRTAITQRQRSSSVEEALIEMILLGRCRTILGTYFSSFSKFSALWSGIEYRELRNREIGTNRMVQAFQNAVRAE